MFRQECKIKILCPEQGFPAFEPAFLAAFPNSVIKARAAARVPRSHSAPHIRTPPRGRRVPRLCVALCSCVGARKMSANARASSAFAAAFLAALIIVPQKQLFDTCLKSFVKKSAAGRFFSLSHFSVMMFVRAVLLRSNPVSSRLMRQSVKAGVREDLRGRLRSGMRAQYQKQ